MSQTRVDTPWYLPAKESKCTVLFLTSPLPHHRNLIEAQVQPQGGAQMLHTTHTQQTHSSQQTSRSSSSSNMLGSSSARNLLDQVLGPQVATWGSEPPDSLTGMAAAAAPAGGGFKADSEQMQQYGVSQVRQMVACHRVYVLTRSCLTAIRIVCVSTHVKTGTT